MRMLDDRLLNRVKTLNATGAAEAVEEAFRASEAESLLELFHDVFSSEAESQWASLAFALERVDAAQTEKRESHYIDKIEDIISLCWSRSEDEYAAAEHFQNTDAFVLWRAIGHLQAATLKFWLEKWLLSAGLTSRVDINAITTAYGRWHGLVQVARFVQEHTWQTPPQPTPESVESVLMHIMKRKNVPEEECDIFGKCELCWRFVPLAYATGHNHLYCQRHQWNTLEYKRALKLLAAANYAQTMDGFVNRLYRRSREQWVAYHHNLPGNWVLLFRDDIVALAQSITEPMEYHHGLLERYFPNVRAFVEKAGMDFSPTAIANALDPIPAETPADIRIRWEALHHVFINNLALFRREMCHAEIFLGLYDRLFANVKRGGARSRKKA